MTAPQPPAADDLVERLNAIDEESMYEQPATTKATIDQAASRIAALEARVKELEEALRLCAQIVKHERDVLYDSNTSGDPPTLDPDSADYIAEYDRALAAARAALGER